MGVKGVETGVVVAAVVAGLLGGVQSVVAQTAPEFEDVPEGHVAEEAIDWAAEKGITVGVGDNRFGMGQTLTRYEMVTFLCRAFDPSSCGSGTRGSDRFVDVTAGHWADFSVGWAVDQLITTGVSATEFGGSQTLVREQMMTFLYRATGSPSGGSRGSDIFWDVPSDRSQWADLPIGWAFDQGITGGVADGTFGFGTNVSREEMVLFLCRALAPDTCQTSQDPLASSVASIEGLSPAISAQVWEAMETTEGIRRLEFVELPDVTVLSPEDFEARVRMDVDSQLEGIEVDEALYKLLGLLEPDDDLRALYGELYGESAAGFYSSEDKELVVPASGEEFTARETVTLVHELVHALTDQHFDFGSRRDELVDSQQYDPASGLIALVEGDATLAQAIYVNSLDVAARNRLEAESAASRATGPDIPLFMEKALYFPYGSGFEYVLNRWREGGWKAVNDLYLNPPRSTEEIYEGAPSPSTEPIRMERPAGALPDGYEEIYDYTWGFLDILIMFEQILGPELAVDAATGWGGGRSLVGYADDGEVVLVWEYAGDNPTEVEELARLLAQYAAEGMNVGDPQPQGEMGFLASADDYILVAPIPAGLVIVACSDPHVCPSVTTAYLP